MRDATRTALVSHLSDYPELVEIGIGHRTDLAETLVARNCTVTATDIHDRPVPDGVQFVRDDITDPDRSVYADADALYALNLPPELHRPAWNLSQAVGVPFLFTTLGADQPAIPVDRRRLPVDTLFVATDAPNRNG